MPALRDMAATYRGPRRVVRRLLDAGRREDRALALVMGACVVLFIAQWPRLARQAHLEGTELNPLLGGSLLGIVFIAPLLLYLLAALVHLVLRLFGARGGFYEARIALFWALFASSPLLLLHGLVAGFVGAGPQLALVGVLWLAVFLWFWIAGLREAEWGPAR